MKKKIILTKRLAFLYKISIVLGLSALPLAIVTSIVLYNFFCFNNIDIIFNIAIFSLIFFGTIVLIFPFVVSDPNKVMSPIVKADKYKAKVTTFENFLDEAETALQNDGFS